MIGQWNWTLLLVIFLFDGSTNLSVRGQEKKTAIAFSIEAAQVNQVPSKLNDDLIKAAKDGKTAKVKELLAKGASADARDKKGHSAVSLAFTAEAYDAARVLLQR